MIERRTISVGPSYTTKRQEGAEMMTQVMQGNPEMMNLLGDIYFRILDVPYGDKIAERFKTMLPPNVLQAEAEDKGQNSPENMKLAIQMLEQKLQEAQAVMQGMQEAVSTKEQELQQAEQELTGQAAQIKQELTELQAQKEILTEYSKRISAELQVKQMQAEKAVSDAVAGAEQPPVETQPQPTQPQSGGVNIVDLSMFRGPIDELAQLVAQQAQQAQQTTEQIGQALGSLSQQLQQLAQMQSAPKTIEYGPDGLPVSIGGRKVAYNEHGMPSAIN